jgi:ABC-type transporter Mla maintaining outer membrane lipid asymmetry ATPase subunit MlaF
MEVENKNKEQEVPAITIRDLYKSFGDNQVLQGINLDVFSKENVVCLEDREPVNLCS